MVIGVHKHKIRKHKYAIHAYQHVPAIAIEPKVAHICLYNPPNCGDL